MTSWQEKTFTAAQCRACGARGPVRPVLAANDFDAVSRLAADDWNHRVYIPEDITEAEAQEILERVDAEEAAAKEKPQRVPSVESLATADELGATTDPEPDNGGSVVDSPNSCAESVRGPTTAVPQDSSGIDEGRLRSDPPGGGGGNGTQKRKYKKRRSTARDKANRHPIAERIEAKPNEVAGKLRKFLEKRELTAEQAAKMYKGLLGASRPSLYNILAGKKVSGSMLENVSAALDKLEKKIAPKAEPDPPTNSPLVEKLPNKFAPITGRNPIPSLTPPPRCSRVT